MDKIKDVLIVVLILIAIGLGLWGGVVSHQYKNYKESINDQVQQAKNEKIRIEAIQNERYNMAQTGYSSAIDILNERLRNLKAVPRDCTVPVAGNSPCGVPRETTDTGDAQIKLETFKGACSSEFYEAALRDTLQCESLIAICK